MIFFGLVKKVPLAGAFFIASSLSSSPSTADCSVDFQSLSTATVRHVHDGDTFTLLDNRRVRLIGINTPELQRGHSHQPLAIEARNYLRKLLFLQGNKIGLKTGRQATDNHGRLLAHAYLKDGRSIAELLISEGYGWVVAVGENTTMTGCLKSAEDTARNTAVGIWSAKKYEAFPAKKLKLRKRGFNLIKGTATRYNESLHAIWLHLDNKLALRIPKSVLANFPLKPSTNWIGQTLEVRGWLYTSKGQLMMNVYHPAALRQIDEAPMKE